MTISYAWFVGASFGSNDDQSSRFINQGIWEVSNPTAQESEFINNSMLPGDKIAIKSSYVRKHNLPFDVKGKSVSVMAIKAIGTITENLKNGSTLKVDWTALNPIKEWYFYTYQKTIWHVKSGQWPSDGLLNFTFENKQQNFDQFLNDPYWISLYSNSEPDSTQKNLKASFWIEKCDVHGRADREAGANALGQALWTPQKAKGESGADIYANMRRIKKGDLIIHLIDRKAIVGVSIASDQADVSFKCLDGTDWEGLPGYRVQLQEFTKLDPPISREEIFKHQEALLNILDTHKGLFYNKKLELNQGKYLTEAPKELVLLLNNIYLHNSGSPFPHFEPNQSATSINNFNEMKPMSIEPYSFKEALEDLFMIESDLKSIVATAKRKKNIILQGPPGVGKTFVSKRMAYLIMGEKDPSRIEYIQFHQSYSYEDFVQGWRPNSNAGFTLKNGSFYEFCEKAKKDLGKAYVFIIDEINRGNLSKIFGELLMLIESDKRGSTNEIKLTYSERDSDKFSVPENVFLIGLMNTADRSLALVDYALRRRFAFFTLSPKFESEQFSLLITNAGGSLQLVNKIRERIGRLNKLIRGQQRDLGPGFEIGHSYFCPSDVISNDSSWYESIIKSEIEPLIEEYWFDDPEKVESLVNEILS